MRRKNWIRESDSLERFSHYCAPTALAALTGISRLAAAATLMAVPGLVHDRIVGAVDGWAWDQYLIGIGGRKTYPTHQNTSREMAKHDRQMDDYFYGHRKTEPKMKRDGELCTVARWLKQFPRATAVLLVQGHTLFAKNGKVVGDTLANKSMRRQVTSAMVF